MTEQLHVVIVGGGFAGLFATRRLARGPVRVTVLDRTGVHLFQPLLYQVATGLLSEGQISAPLRHLFRRHRNVDTLVAEVTDVDATRKKVHARTPDGRTLEVGYDVLLVAAGVQQSYFGHDDFAQHAPGLKDLDDALTIRRRVYQAFETAEALPTAEQRRPWLTFALVGGGPTGVELAGQLRELATHTLRDEFRSIDPAEAKVLLLDGGDRVLASFSSGLSGRAARTLRRLGVEIRTGSRVTGVDEGGLDVTDPDGSSRRVEARTVLWTAGVAAPPLADAVARATGAEQGKDGRLRVLPDLSLPGHPDVYVAGDLMSLDHLPGVAETAMQAGLHVAGQVLHRVDHPGGVPAGTPFRYRDLGSAAYVSRGHALLEAGPVRLSGLPGWLAWGLIHLTFLTGYRNRAAALSTWLTTLALGTRRERAFPSGTATSDRQHQPDAA